MRWARTAAEADPHPASPDGEEAEAEAGAFWLCFEGHLDYQGVHGAA